MVVQHNLTAMNSNRMLGLTTTSQAKSTEKLSSGYKINRAADDAAGLSISEKMRKQIRGLTQASLNAEDGISAVQTAEGALNEVQDMLQRINELAVKAANGTMSENDRNYIQNEVDQLVTEIDRVAETTKFNETYLLKGDKNADMEYSFSYSEITPITYTAKGSAARLTLGANPVYDSNGEPVTGDALAGADEFADLTETYHYGRLPYGTIGPGTNVTDQFVTTGNIVSINSGDGGLEYVGDARLYDNRGEVIDERDLGIYLHVSESGGSGSGFDTITVVTEPVATARVADNTKKITEDNWQTYFQVVPSTPYAFTATTGGNAVTNLAAFVEVDGNNLVYIDDAETLSVNGTPIPEGNLGNYMTFEIGETVVVAFYDADGNKIPANALGNYIDVDETGNMEMKDDAKIYKTPDGDPNMLVETDDLADAVSATQDLVAARRLTLHVGADATANNQISIDIAAMSADGLGIVNDEGKLLVNGNTDANALSAIDTIKEAIQKVSTQRSALGAVQNRLEHTIANLDNVVENTTAAESQIRDTDMATEMVRYSNNNILAQAGQAMLAQANQANQGVLSLLQ